MLMKFKDFYLTFLFLTIKSDNSSKSGGNSYFSFNYGTLLGIGGFANSLFIVIMTSFWASIATYSVWSVNVTPSLEWNFNTLP